MGMENFIIQTKLFCMKESLKMDCFKVGELLMNTQDSSEKENLMDMESTRCLMKESRT